MKELLAEVIRIGLPLSLMAVMFAQGLKLSLGQSLAFLKENPGLMLRSLGVVLVLVPLTALAIILLFDPAPAVMVGLALMAASPASPSQLIKFGKNAEGLAFLSSLHLSLGLLAIISVPAVLYLLSRALGFQAEVDAFQVAKSVGQTMLVPVALGVLFRRLLPVAANRIAPLLGKLATISLYAMLIPVLVKTFALVLEMDVWSYLVMASFMITNLVLGHLLGPADAQQRTILAMESGGRNFGLALTIAALNFSQDKALAVLIPYVLLFVVISKSYLKWSERGATD
jgi:BASS family bile acid:Na+ symporter